MRNTVVKSARFWFVKAHQAAKKGDYKEAFLGMEQALNHTESALNWVREKVPGVKEEMNRVEDSNGKAS